MSTSNTGGFTLSASAESRFLGEAVGDVLLYSSNTMKIHMGPMAQNGDGVAKAAIALSSNLVDVANNIIIGGTTTVNQEILLGFNDGPVRSAEEHWFSFSNNATFASTALFASSNLFMGPSSFSNTTLTVGSNANVTYPLMVQTANNENISLYTTGDVVGLSDARFKSDVRLITDAVAKVAAIGGYTFAWSGRSTNERSAGVLAQEVQAVLPEVVSTDSDGKLSVAYGNLTALIIEAIKELAGRQELLTITTTTPDEEFSVPLSPGREWKAVLVSSSAGYSMSFARVYLGNAIGRIEFPGTYHLLAVC